MPISDYCLCCLCLGLSLLLGMIGSKHVPAMCTEVVTACTHKLLILCEMSLNRKAPTLSVTCPAHNGARQNSKPELGYKQDSAAVIVMRTCIRRAPDGQT